MSELRAVIFGACLLLLAYPAANAQTVYPVTTACGQQLVFVNGKYHQPCENGYIDESNNCVEYVLPTCPPNYVLVNGYCYLKYEVPPANCPEGYTFVNNTCRPTISAPCSGETTTSTALPLPTTLPPPTSTTTAVATTEPTSTSTSTSTSTQTSNRTTAPLEPEPTPEVATTTPPPSPTPTATPAQTSTPISSSTPTPPTTSTTTSAPTEPEPAPVPVPEPETTATPLPDLATEPETALPFPTPPPESLTRCPPGSVYSHERCRKIICTRGEYYAGQCYVSACADGLVWRGGSCQKPAYITTIIEVENIFRNEVLRETTTVTEQQLHTTSAPAYKTSTGTTIAPKAPGEVRRTTTSRPIEEREPGCCWVRTPRICKLYQETWVCFNRRYKSCNADLCKVPLLYLKAPEISYEGPILVLPPNPPLRPCEKPDCDEADTIDCSGCADYNRDRCSPYCYSYMCPKDECQYLDLREYCSKYPGQYGCHKLDGCLWEWCS